MCFVSFLISERVQYILTFSENVVYVHCFRVDNYREGKHVYFTESGRSGMCNYHIHVCSMSQCLSFYANCLFQFTTACYNWVTIWHLYNGLYYSCSNIVQEILNMCIMCMQNYFRKKHALKSTTLQAKCKQEITS